MGAALYAFKRKKNIASKDCLKESVPRVLRTVDLTFLGMGGTLGAGVYVITADVAKNTAGPAVVVSFSIAALAALLCGLCYAEFGARVPKAGSAYTYTYATVGELIAFMVGWNMLLEYLIGAAALSRAWTAYIDSLANNAISKGFMNGIATWTTPGISRYPDFLSLGVCLVVSLSLALGVRISAYVNTLLTAVNLLVVIFVVIVGFGYARPWYWEPFAPFGLSGVLAGAATAFFAFVGFDIIGSSAEEVKDPGKAVPRSIVVSLLVCFISYLGMASAVTLMMPYYALEDDATLAQAFNWRGAIWAKYVLATGAVAGLLASLVSCMFPVPRLLYSMANDGLLFPPFATINSVTNTPLFGSFFSGLIAGGLALYFDLSNLVEMMSIGTLQAYTMVSTCVLLLRYQVAPVGMVPAETGGFQPLSHESVVSEKETVQLTPTRRTAMLVNASTAVVVLAAVGINGLFVNFSDYLKHGQFWSLLALFFFVGAFTVAMTIIYLQPQNKFDIPFAVPLVPLLPVASVFINIALMMNLAYITWIRFGVWIVIGLSIYLFYGVQHSKEGK